MRFKHCAIKNFGSYKNFTLDFSTLGLVSVTGETGSGKSTILDMVPWILFGETSKGTKVDEVATWGSEEPTIGVLEVELSDGMVLTIVRTRGTSSQNDLYFSNNKIHDLKIRGKSILETQKLLEEHLKINADLYFTSAYLHQFSKADTFFVARPSERREVFEKIVDQSLAIKLGENTSESRKIVKKDLEGQESEAKFRRYVIESDSKRLDKLQSDGKYWQEHKDANIAKLQEESDKFELLQDMEMYQVQRAMNSLVYEMGSFDDTKVQLEEAVTAVYNDSLNLKMAESGLHKQEGLDGTECPTCKRSLDGHDNTAEISTLKDNIIILKHNLEYSQEQLTSLKERMKKQELLEKYQDKMNKIADSVNTNVYKLDALKNEKNIYESQAESLFAKLEQHKKGLIEIESSIFGLKHQVSLLDMLYDLTFDLRGAILNNALTDIEKSTNNILSSYFDSEILVKFSLESSDKLELEMQKNGNSCSFKQLSGGQRCMLKLAFNLSLMALAENKAGVKFHTLMLDEPLTGLSDDLKIKAFSLFESLTKNYETIVVVEHSLALNTCFSNRLMVTMVGDESKVEDFR